VNWLVGVDVGGTFTDFFAVSVIDGSLRYFKRPSTPHNPGEAIFTGLAEMCESLAIEPADIDRICHGTTVATNALIQRRGGTVAMITTEGFRDLLEIGRQTRPHMFSLQLDQPAPLVPRERRFEITERIDARGEAIVTLDEDTVETAIAAVEASGAGACAVCGLFAFVNDAHERRIGELLCQRLPGMHVSLSSEVRREFREYERFSTTVLNAYLQPVMNDYLDFLQSRIAEFAPKAPVRIYQSSGGLMSVETAKAFPVRTALSGPAAGAVGAVFTARQVNRPRVITLDMGGTSADVALIRDYDAGVSTDRDVAGFPVRLPMVDINTVGAGGGSIAWFDPGGMLKVGPASAGADPGPACYGKGGKDAAVSDANLVLGRLSPGGLIGGRMELDTKAARDAIAPIADNLGFSIEQSARGILGIVIANMVRAIRTISVERGLDPRDYALMAYGGAGPLHATETARVLGIKEIIIPVAPGILCAQGLIVSDLREEFVRSGRFPVTKEGYENVEVLLEELAAEAQSWFESEDVAAPDRRLQVSLDARYVGQNFELPVVFAGTEAGVLPDPGSAGAVVDAFHKVHERLYGFHSLGEPVEIVNVRVIGSGRLGRIPDRAAEESCAGQAVPVGSRRVWFDDEDPLDTPVFDRDTLKSGMTITGPAIVEQLDTTTVLFPGDKLHVEPSLNLLIAVSAEGGHAR
jgi:N-methylhydantoinase A